AEADRMFLIDTSNIVKNYRFIMPLVKDSVEKRRSDIMQMNSLIYSMQLNQTMISLRSRPIFGLKVAHFLTPAGPDLFSVMGTMTIPLAPWAARGYRAQERAMGFRITAMQQEKQQMVNMTYQMIRSLSIEMNSEYQEIDTYTMKVIPAYKKSLEAYLLAYGQNTSSLPMVLMSYDNMQMAQMEYIEHLHALLKIQADYERQMQIR
ncbi:MAG TPA: hypothetical protein VI731_04385, partial [Bacteroidia bacterium]|nr:hypothetical protein [Bacteroidia bacterium]